MAISRERKEELVAQYTELLQQSKAIFLTDYSGISVQQLQELRAEVRKIDGAFHITKNTLFSRALQTSGRTVPTDLLQGQTAAGFVMGELPAMAKALVDFSEEMETFRIKGGLMDGAFLSVEEIESLAKLPSLDELRAQIIGLVSAPGQNIALTVANGVRQLINVLNAYAQEEEAAGEAA